MRSLLVLRCFVICLLSVANCHPSCSADPVLAPLELAPYMGVRGQAMRQPSASPLTLVNQALAVAATSSAGEHPPVGVQVASAEVVEQPPMVVDEADLPSTIAGVRSSAWRIAATHRLEACLIFHRGIAP